MSVGDRLYYCPHCSFRHTSIVALVEHKRDEHSSPVEPQPKSEAEE